MGRKKRKSARQTSNSRPKEPQSEKSLKLALPMILAMAVLLVTGGIKYFRNKPVRPIEHEQIRAAVAADGLMETRPTLAPELFFGTVREAYAIAREIPEVLDQLYCYCRCRENFNHLNLLTCYTNRHAST